MIYGNVWALTMGLLIPNEIALWFANVEYEIREVEDSRYGSVKAYHTDVIEAFQHALKADHNILWKYRRRCAAEGLPDMVKQPCSLVRRTGLLS